VVPTKDEKAEEGAGTMTEGDQSRIETEIGIEIETVAETETEIEIETETAIETVEEMRGVLDKPVSLRMAEDAVEALSLIIELECLLERHHNCLASVQVIDMEQADHLQGRTLALDHVHALALALALVLNPDPDPAVDHARDLVIVDEAVDEVITVALGDDRDPADQAHQATHPAHARATGDVPNLLHDLDHARYPVHAREIAPVREIEGAVIDQSRPRDHDQEVGRALDLDLASQMSKLSIVPDVSKPWSNLANKDKMRRRSRRLIKPLSWNNRSRSSSQTSVGSFNCDQEPLGCRSMLFINTPYTCTSLLFLPLPLPWLPLSVGDHTPAPMPVSNKNWTVTKFKLLVPRTVIAWWKSGVRICVS